VQKAFVFDINKCTGCQACQVACVIENELDFASSWRQVNTFNATHAPGMSTFHLSLACNHCVDAPCMEHCPALAYTKDPETGAVTINASSCIGCQYCAWACPFDAPKFNRRAGVMEKCTFCNHRLQEGQSPACVNSCPTGALQFADLDEAPGVDTSPGFPQTVVGPAIRFIPLEEGRTVPQTSVSPAAAARQETSSTHAMPPSKITLRSEWPLLVFTLLTAILVGWFASGNSVMSGGGLVFLALAAIGAGLSTMHLGRPLRAHRAALNWRRSWLSREIILFSVFGGTAALYLLTQYDVAWIAGTVAGFSMLFAMDRVYEVTGTRGLRLHSAQVLLSGVFFYGLFSMSPAVFVGAAAVKLVTYIVRKRAQRHGDPRVIASAGRIFFGILLPVALCEMNGFGVVVTASALVGEVIDRCEYYLELNVSTPRRQMALDAHELILRR